MNIRKKFIMTINKGLLEILPDEILLLIHALMMYIIAIIIVFFTDIIVGDSFILAVIIIVLDIFFTLTKKGQLITLPFTYNILLYRFGKYGKVITWEDWSKIRKHCPKLYRQALSKISYGYCYDYTRLIALYLTDATLLYCSVVKIDGTRTGHCVIMKNNYIYDTNAKLHVSYENYSNSRQLLVYKIFTYEEYSKASFFDDILPDFERWCSENNTFFD